MTNTQNGSRLAIEFESLPLVGVTPQGWLRRHIEILAEDLTGYLDEFWPDLVDNQCLGDKRCPYYADGLERVV